ncbi:MAG: hypothetical protein K0B07_00055 [DPANN group archaeon]|nr:hypothetical protein [DPANN group archaeon]
MNMIDKKYFIFLFGIIGLLIIIQVQSSILESSITGNLLLSEVNVSINAYDNGKVSILNYSDRIEQYSKLVIGAEFLNTGSTSYSKSLLLQIGTYDENMTISANRTGTTIVMKPGDRSFDKLTYTPLYYGFYWMHLIVSYGNKTADAWGTFYVDPYYIIVIPPNVTEGEPGGPLDVEDTTGGDGDGLSMGGGGDDVVLSALLDSGIYDTGRILVTLSHPDKISVRPGQSSVVYVIVNNTGTMTLRRMMLLPRIIGNIKIEAQPMNIQTLKGGQSAIFMITLDVPYDIYNRTYPLDFKVLFDKDSRAGHIDVEVGPGNLEDDLLNIILNYRYIITRLTSERDKLYFEGKNTTLLDEYISDADYDLVIAKENYDLGDYGPVREYLNETLNHLEDAVLELASLRKSDTFVLFATNVWFLIVLMIIISIVIAEVYMHKRKHKKYIKYEGEDAIV